MKTKKNKRKFRVLLVDDDIDAAGILSQLLDVHGLETLCMTALSSLMQIKDYAPDVVLLDLDMPGMSGFEVATAIRKTEGIGEIGIFALSGWSDAEVREQCKNLGFDGFFAKPTPLDDIIAAIMEYMRFAQE